MIYRLLVIDIKYRENKGKTRENEGKPPQKRYLKNPNGYPFDFTTR